MPAEHAGDLNAQAIAWRLRLSEGDDTTWEAFAAWLAEDTRHAAAYDAVEAADLALEPILPHLVLPAAANDAHPARPSRRRVGRWTWAGGAVAAGLAAAIVLPQMAPSRYEVSTGAGERRVVRLDETTEVTLNGATNMTFDRRNPRYAALGSGEAHFRVRHDARKPFRLLVAGRIVEDAGTIFNVVHHAGEVRVAVAEGKVIYDAERAALPLVPGQEVIEQTASGEVAVSEVARGQIGTWTAGALVYVAAPMSQVAEDLARALGVRISVSPAVAARPFTGTIRLDGRGPEELRRIAPALDVRLVQTSEGWRLDPPPSRAGG